jgi:hypothetical protein
VTVTSDAPARVFKSASSDECPVAEKVTELVMGFGSFLGVNRGFSIVTAAVQGSGGRWRLPALVVMTHFSPLLLDAPSLPSRSLETVTSDALFKVSRSASLCCDV